MPTLATTVDGLKLPNPFVIGSGPPGTNLNVINARLSRRLGRGHCQDDQSRFLESRQRHAALRETHGRRRQGIVGWENIELISDRPFDIWLDEFKKCKDQFPDGMLIASIMEEYNKDAWIEIVERCARRRR